MNTNDLMFMMNKEHKENKALNLHDRPITNTKDDYFDINTRVVEKIFNLVTDTDVAPLSVAMTGEWGSGKTSAINLLVNKLNLNNKKIVIFFEPLLEGKTSLAEIIELFYLKLYQEIDDKKIKKIIIKSFKGLATLLRAKFTGNIALPGNSASATLEYDLSKNIDDLFKLFDDNSPKPFSIQTQELNMALKKNSYKLYIILDEIDRLPATHIITMLMFARTIETFDNLICIIGLDYKQVINKIIKEKALGMADYETTKSYLDKLFQANFHIDISTDKKIKFAVELLKKIDIDNIFCSILESDDHDDRVKFEKIIFHLGTPRKIKKWIISIKINYPIIKHCPNKLDFIAFLSSATVHYILSENISKHTLPLLCRRHFKELYLKDIYEINFTDKDNSKNSDEETILSSAGISVNSNNENIQKFLQLVTEYPIHESLAKNFTKSFLINTPVHFLILYIEGYADDKKVSAYNDFFEKDLDKALNILIADDDSKATLAFDLAETIRKNSLDVKGTPSLNLLNKLWLQKIDESSNFGVSP